MTPEVSVVVISHGPSRWLDECLRSLRRQTTPAAYEVIVVMNPADPAAPASSEALPGARRIELRRKLDPGEARNAGWRAAAGEIVAFLMANCTVLPGWIDALREEHRRRPGHPIGGPVRIAADSRALPTAAYFCGLINRLSGEVEGYVDNWSICNMSYPKALLEAAGGFPDGPGGSDDELHRRLRVSRGIRIWASPRPAVELHPIDRLSDFLGREFREGRIYADLHATREGLSSARRTARALAWWLLPWFFFVRGFRAVRHDPQVRRTYLGCAHLLLLGWTARALGDATGLLRGADMEGA
jgi:glycosyltransferase involved in cell wall biosynthesis